MRKRHSNSSSVIDTGASMPSIASANGGRGDKVVSVLFTADEVNLLINVIRATPVQGNLQTLRPMIVRLEALQAKLVESLKPPP